MDAEKSALIIFKMQQANACCRADPIFDTLYHFTYIIEPLALLLAIGLAIRSEKKNPDRPPFQ